MPVLIQEFVHVHPGYLSDGDLLSQIDQLRTAIDPVFSPTESLFRHNLLAAEICLRRLADISLHPLSSTQLASLMVEPDDPYTQFEQLRHRYQNSLGGRIPLPQNAQQLWSQHKYSVMARDVNLYKKVGKQVALLKPSESYHDLALLLAQQLNLSPKQGGIYNALQHMWGYVSTVDPTVRQQMPEWTNSHLLAEIQYNALKIKQFYLLSSTALSELYVWITDGV